MNILEFAQKVGHSTATVSRAFHEPHKLRPKTREHILAVARELNYYPNANGRALVTGKHDTLGVLWPLNLGEFDSVILQRTLGALSREFFKHNLDFHIFPVDQYSTAASNLRQTFLRARCDGWISLYPRFNDELVQCLRKSGKPVVCLMGWLAECPDWPWVRLNEREWIEDALRRFKAAGASKILFYGHRPEVPSHAERLAAFTELASVYFGAHSLTLPHAPLEAGKLRKLLAADTVNGVIGADDQAANFVLQQCARLQIPVPDRVRLVGINDIADPLAGDHQLSTYRQPLDSMVAAAMDIVMGHSNQSRLFSATFVPRATLPAAEPLATAQESVTISDPPSSAPPTRTITKLPLDFPVPSGLRAVAVYFGRDFNEHPAMYFTKKLHAELQKECARNGIEMQSWINAERVPAYLDRLKEAVASGQIQGLIGASIRDETEYATLAALPVPSTFHFAVNSPNKVSNDMQKLFSDAIDHLQSRGCSKIGLISHVHIRNEDGKHSPYYQYFIEQLSARGLETRHEWIRSPRELAAYALDNDQMAEFGRDSFRALWQLPNRPDSLIVYPDNVVEGVIPEITRLNVAVPQDLRVVFHRNENINIPCPFPAMWATISVRKMAQADLYQIKRLCAGLPAEQINIPFKFAAREITSPVENSSR
ncbi:MAG: substrate-binding domain-containing protein [Verrucomicrobiales bacterium]|jgi:DNA-binding LacI/PurR family transcriptional regulator|nr:substrate-binding domain-containing protein [Verrucomicrobiales bacterium]